MTAEAEIEVEPSVDRRFQCVCFVLTGVALVFTGATGQLHDAFLYVDSASLVINGDQPPKLYGFRGVLTSVVFVPAAVAAKFGLPLQVAVLVQNSALLAAMGAFVIPAVLRALVPVTRARVAMGCLFVVVALGRFAPPGLMDIWAAATMLVALALVARPSSARVLIAAALLGAAINLRPAYLLPTLMLLLAWAVWVRRHTLWLVLGATMAVVPQLLVELVRPGSFGQWTDGLSMVNGVQLTYAPWVVRYDTAPPASTAPDPSLFFCDPAMAAVQQAPISSPVDLLVHLASNAPDSLMLLAEKASAWFLWSWTTPYFEPTEPKVSHLGVLVVSVIVLGALGWISAGRAGQVPRPLLVAVVAVSIGMLGGTITSTPEARFALPLVVLGLVGTLLVGLEKVRGHHVAGVFVAVVLIVVVGRQGLRYPIEGVVTPGDCAAMASGTSAAGAIEGR